MKRIRKTLAILLSSAMSFVALSACGETDGPVGPDPAGPGGEEEEKYVYYDYTAEHASEDRNVGFYSSDETLDLVLNEYRERHMRNTENRIHSHPVGAGGTAWKEWEAMSGSWWDASAANGTMSPQYATKDLVTAWLRSAMQDRQGYIWTDDGTELASWSMGWEFPDYDEGGQYWLFDENGNAEGWEVIGGKTAEVSGGKLNVLAEGAERIEFVSPHSEEGFCTTTVSPFLRLGMAYSPSSDSDIGEIYVYYRTNDADDWSEERKVSLSAFCINGVKVGSGSLARRGYFFPMYLQEGWGWEVGRNARRITGVKIVAEAAPGKKISGSFAVDYVTSEFDDRQSNNICNYLIAAQEIVSFSQDTALLSEIMPKARRAMNFLLNQLKGKEGLISTEYLMGHYNDGLKATGTGIGNGYWDVLAFPKVNLYCNISYYNALRAMQFLEEMCAARGIVPQAVSTVNAAMDGEDVYAETSDSLAKLAESCAEQIRTYFWNERTGRFHVGFLDDGNGKIRQDHGYVMFNEQVIEAGIATDEQIKSVMSWINGERTVAGDLSSGEDIYKFEFAPRFNTGEIGSDFYYGYSAVFDGNVQNGGTALHLAYYDLAAQARTGNAYSRLEAIRDWYMKVRAAGGKGWEFYRAYYNTTDIGVQGGGTGGMIGLDYEFLEAAVLIRAIPEVFFGLNARADGTLSVTPSLPKELDYWRLENLTFAGYYYDLSIGRYFAQISGTKEYRAGSGYTEAKTEIVFPVPKFTYEIYLNGEKTENFRTEDGKLIVTMPFRDGKVEIKAASAE